MPLQFDPIPTGPTQYRQQSPLFDALLKGIGAGQQVQQFPLEQALRQANMQKAQGEAMYAPEIAKADYMYKQAMANYLMSPGGQGRGLSPLGKELNEQMAGLGGRLPQGIQPNNVTGNNAELAYDPYALQIQKTVTDPAVRQKTLFAQNIDKTLAQINPEHLAKFSDVFGGAKYLGEKGLSAAGMAPQEYKDYELSAKAAKMLSKQVRQFYGDSIQPEMEAQLEELANPARWSTDPELMKDQFNQFKKILQSETGTYQQALKSTRPYEEQKSPYGPKTKLGQSIAVEMNKPGKAAQILAKDVASGKIQFPQEFDSPEAFQTWWTNQSEPVRKAYRMYLQSEGVR